MLGASRSRPAATKFEILFRKKQWRYVIVQEERDKSEEHFEVVEIRNAHYERYQTTGDCPSSVPFSGVRIPPS
jgi:hypothetical protein